MSEQPFLPITLHSSWGYWDRLDGKDLKSGETLEIEWPDGSLTIEKIGVDKSRFTIGEQGGNYEASDEKAYVNVLVRGLPIKAYLRGAMTLRARRVT